MEIGQPSRTAFAAARHRATHQLVEGGRVFADPLAVPILGADPDELIRDAAERPTTRRMRGFIAARTRHAEEALAAAVDGGARQLVVLGAGLDTFGCRNPYPELRVFEVDHPDTQAWKRDRLAAAGIAAPASVTFVPVDFERQTLAGALPAAGFDPGAPAFFSWLGVVPYLTRAGFDDTIGFVAGLPGGAEVVFDYAQPPESMPAEWRAAHQARADRVASIGEPWLTYFSPVELATDLRSQGLTEIEDLGPAQLAARYLGRPDVPANTPGGHVIRAAHRR